MILLNRRTPKSRAQQIRGELAEGFGHLRSATSSAATGAAEKMAPHIDSALTVIGLRKKRPRRWPWIAGAVAAGTAVGVAGMVLMMRRNSERSDELFVDGPEVGNVSYADTTIDRRVEEMAGSTAN